MRPNRKFLLSIFTLVILIVIFSPLTSEERFSILIASDTYISFGIAFSASDGIVYVAREGKDHVGKSNGAIVQWKTTNNGKTFKRTVIYDSPYDERNVAGGRTSNGNYVIAFANKNLEVEKFKNIICLKSTNEGLSWDSVCTFPTYNSTSFSPYGGLVELPDKKILIGYYINNENYNQLLVISSTDNGNSWNEVDTVFSSDSIIYDEASYEFISGETDTTSKIICVTRCRTGIGKMNQFQSTDGGKIWFNMGNLNIGQDSTNISPFLFSIGEYLHLIWADRFEGNFKRFMNIGYIKEARIKKECVVSSASLWESPQKLFVHYGLPPNYGYPSVIKKNENYYRFFFADDLAGFAFPNVWSDFRWVENKR